LRPTKNRQPPGLPVLPVPDEGANYFAFAFIALTGAAVGFAAAGFFASFLGFFASLAGFDAPFAMGVDLHHHDWRCEVKREA
jgi:hypothetical protein